MLFNSFAHRLLLTFGFVVLVVVAVFAAKIGLLGDLMQTRVAWMLSQLHGFYDENRSDLDFAAKLIGAVGTALGAAWTVHKGWHYAERSLPERLNDLNARWRDESIERRPRDIPALAQVFSIAAPAAAEPGPLMRMVLWFHDTARKALIASESELEDHKSEFCVLTSSRVRCRAEVITSHLVVGSHLARSNRSQEALDTYEKSLRFNRADLDALELSAKQAFALNFRERACRHLEALADAAARAGKPIRRARAMRFLAEVLKGGKESERELARETLVAILDALDDINVRSSDEKELELGLANVQLADVQITRGKLRAARTALTAAKVHLANAGSLAGQDARNQLKAATDRLGQADKDKDKVRDDQDESN